MRRLPPPATALGVAALVALIALSSCGGTKIVEPAQVDLASLPQPSAPSTAPRATAPGATAPGATAPGTTAPGSNAPPTSAPVAKSDGAVTFLDISAPEPPNADMFIGPALDVDGLILAFGADDAVSPGSLEQSAVWSSADQGATWQRIGRGLGVPGGAQTVNDAVRIGSRLIAVGADESTNRSGESTSTDAAVWSSDDRGTTWRSVGQAIFANRPGAQVIWAVRAAGDRLVAIGLSADTGAAGSANAVAWLSDDRGETWREVAIDARPDYQAARALAVVGTKLVAAGAERVGGTEVPAVWVSDDGAERWTRVASDAFTPGPASAVVAKVVAVGANLVAIAAPVAVTPRAFVSADGGATWRQSSTSDQPLSGDYRSALVVDNRIYLSATVAATDRDVGLLWVSDDQGAKWQLVSRDHIVANRFSQAGAVLRTATGRILLLGRIDREDASDLAVASINLR